MVSRRELQQEAERRHMFLQHLDALRDATVDIVPGTDFSSLRGVTQAYVSAEEETFVAGILSPPIHVALPNSTVPHQDTITIMPSKNTKNSSSSKPASGDASLIVALENMSVKVEDIRIRIQGPTPPPSPKIGANSASDSTRK
ncbi:hypothetical protein DFP72DRAFT_1064617 [Ephemerocybe angulata]|uniref:Uncharacterized protein n=1 Tax=Ephemerocybe angulata TaxID=980116 RepID=A0A8H6I4A8_9AGAR|nr:hypothetical protein DFP72DRAFT_1064617 [Tulosesus angulatus]